MPITNIRSATLGEFNVALVGALAVLNPLAAQIDALIAIGLGPFKLGLMAQVNASASLSLFIGADIIARLNLLLTALAQLQATLSAEVFIGVSANIDIDASLAIQVGLLELAIEAALGIKIPAIRLAASLAAQLAVGPVFALTTEGELAPVGAEIASEFSSGLSADGNTIPPTGVNTYGVYLLASDPSAILALQAIIQVG